MRLAIQTPVQDTSFDRLRALWQIADQSGFAAAFTFDHFVALAPGARPGNIGDVPDGPQLEGWITLAALAVETRNLAVGTLVSSVTHRPPAVLAKMVATLDAVTAGRAILGVGAGWHQTEHGMLGIEFPPVGDRMTLLEETIRVFRALCETDGPVHYRGEFVQIDGAPFEPKAVRASGIPILVGGSGRRLRGIVARHADIYNGFWSPEEWGEVNRGLDEGLLSAGRSPLDVERSAFVPAELSADPARRDRFVASIMRTRGGSERSVRARTLVGEVDEMREVLASYGDAGVEMVVVSLGSDADPTDLERFAVDVMPGLRS